ncbi:MAG: metallophosphoesterase family protein [Balneolaceae bacterium]
MPKIALISDIHANLPALQAILKILEKEQPDVWICLGDLVGYGPHPKECIEEIRERNIICVQGNHDAGVAGNLKLQHFKNPNRRLIELSQDLITKEQRKWLSSLPLILSDEEQLWIAAHASPVEPEKWQYLESAIKVRILLPKLEQRLCFVGHTHRPAMVSDAIGLNKFEKGHKYFINPGSVGQPRDGDSRASCAIVDTENSIYKNIRASFNVNPVLMDLENLGFSRREAEQMMRV